MTDSHKAWFKGAWPRWSSLGNRLGGQGLWAGRWQGRARRNNTCEEWGKEDSARKQCQHSAVTEVSGDPTGSSEAEMALQGHPQWRQGGQDLYPCNDQLLATGCSWGGDVAGERQHPSAEGNAQGETHCERSADSAPGSWGKESCRPQVGMQRHATVFTPGGRNKMKLNLFSVTLIPGTVQGTFLIVFNRVV